MVERANKLVVEARLKGAGMHWKRENVNPMLLLCNAVCNDRWGEAWQGRRKQEQQRRKRQRGARTQARLAQATARLPRLFLLVRFPTPLSGKERFPSKASTLWLPLRPPLRFPKGEPKRSIVGAGGLFLHGVFVSRLSLVFSLTLRTNPSVGNKTVRCFRST
jgi:hypothetical protein